MIFPHDIVIETGMAYSNFLGEYVVKNMDAYGKMTVSYTSGAKQGQTQVLDAAGQAKVIYNQKMRLAQEMRMKEINLKGQNESFTLGFLAQHSFVFVRVKEAKQQWFETTYKKLTGTQPSSPNIEGNYYTLSPDSVEGSGDYFHIGFPTPDDSIKGLLAFGNEDAIHWDTLGDVSKYNSMNYVLNLFKLGFRMGKKHEVDMIRNSLTHKDDFDKGFFSEIDKVA